MADAIIPVLDHVALGSYFSLNAADLALVLWHLWSVCDTGDRTRLLGIIQLADVEHQWWALQHWLSEAPERTKYVINWVDERQPHYTKPPDVNWNNLAEHMREFPDDVTAALLWMRNEIRLGRGIASDALGLTAALDLPETQQRFHRLRRWAEGSVRRVALLQRWMQSLDMN